MIPTLIIFLPLLFMSSFFISVAAILVSTNCFAASCSRNSIFELFRTPFAKSLLRSLLFANGVTSSYKYRHIFLRVQTFDEYVSIFIWLWIVPWYHFLPKCLLLFSFLCMFFGLICIFIHLFILFLWFYAIWWNNIHFAFTVLSFPIKICYNKCAAQRNPRIYFLAPTGAEMRKLWLLTALPLPV